MDNLFYKDISIYILNILWKMVIYYELLKSFDKHFLRFLQLSSYKYYHNRNLYSFGLLHRNKYHHSFLKERTFLHSQPTFDKASA